MSSIFSLSSFMLHAVSTITLSFTVLKHFCKHVFAFSTYVLSGRAQKYIAISSAIHLLWDGGMVEDQKTGNSLGPEPEVVKRQKVAKD